MSALPKMTIRVLFVFLLLFIIGGCALMTEDRYQPAEIKLPQQWQSQTSLNAAGGALSRFWEGFQDPLLNQLIVRVLEVNNDVKVAAEKIQRARLQAGIAKTDLYPVPSAAAKSTTQKNLDDGRTTKSHSLSAGLSYELDLWNKYSGSYDAATLEAKATVADQGSAMLSLIGTTATLYWQLAYLNQLIDSNEESLVYAEKTLQLIQARYEAGDVSREDLLDSQQEKLKWEQTLEQNRQSLSEARNAFAILFDQAPEPFEDEPTGLADGFLPEVKAGIPADLLHNRPDLQAAELRLRKAHKQIAVTRRSYYPSFSLTGTLGTSSNQLQEILQNPVATLGVGLALPFLEWDLTKLNIQVAESEYKEAIISFRQTLFTALSEVENALSYCTLYQNQELLLQRNLQLAVHREHLSRARYLAGAVSLQDWLDGQEQLRVARRELAENRRNRLQNMMQLFLSLGGAGKNSRGDVFFLKIEDTPSRNQVVIPPHNNLVPVFN